MAAMEVNQNYHSEWSDEEWEGIKNRMPRRSHTGVRLIRVADEGGTPYFTATRQGWLTRLGSRFIW